MCLSPDGAVFAVTAQGDQRLADIGLDLCRLLSQRGREGLAVVTLDADHVLIQFAATPGEAAAMVAACMHASEEPVCSVEAIEAAVLTCMREQAAGLH